MSDPTRNDPFADLYGDFSDRLRGDRWQPDVDVFETRDQVVVRAELAGVSSRDVRVTVDGSELRLYGVRAPHEGAPVQRLHQMEIACGPFERRVRIPVAFDRSQVTARLEHGVLTVTLVKRGRREIPIERE